MSKPFVLWTCPKCEMPIRARGATDVFHECWLNSYRLTGFKPVIVRTDDEQVSA